MQDIYRRAIGTSSFSLLLHIPRRVPIGKSVHAEAGRTNARRMRRPVVDFVSARVAWRTRRNTQHVSSSFIQPRACGAFIHATAEFRAPITHALERDGNCTRRGDKLIYERRDGRLLSHRATRSSRAYLFIVFLPARQPLTSLSRYKGLESAWVDGKNGEYRYMKRWFIAGISSIIFLGEKGIRRLRIMLTVQVDVAARSSWHRRVQSDRWSSRHRYK